ncbi:hypothetical protein ACOME3_006241 [Neoechinorhynchus agilis]
MNPGIVEVLQEILAQLGNELENVDRERFTTEQMDPNDFKIIDGHDSKPKVDYGVGISRQGLQDDASEETNETFSMTAPAINEEVNSLMQVHSRIISLISTISQLAIVNEQDELNDDSAAAKVAEQIQPLRTMDELEKYQSAKIIITSYYCTKKRTHVLLVLLNIRVLIC